MEEHARLFRPFFFVIALACLAVGAPAFAAENSVSGLRVEATPGGVWTVEFDYFYTGQPIDGVLIAELPQDGTGNANWLPPEARHMFLQRAEQGQHHVSARLNYPPGGGITRRVTVVLKSQRPEQAGRVEQQVDQVIEWPDAATYNLNQQILAYTPENNLRVAIQEIDAGDEEHLLRAKTRLEYLLTQNPRLTQAYVEMARVAMKSNWGPEGLHSAENLLLSALQIEPASVNARVLLGYVYTNQGKLDAADKLFAAASQPEPANLWLWTNWGELLLKQGKPDQAAAKFRRAVAHPMTHDTYDRARKSAYRYLLTLLEKRKDLDGMEALYQQRISEFGPGACYSADYARFLLYVRGNPQATIDLARRALNQNCDDSEARELLGLAYYTKWASAKGPDKIDALNQARIYCPVNPRSIYLLASTDGTVPAVRQLLASGEKIDQIDNEHYTALAHAVHGNDLAATKQLLQLGADPKIPVGYEEAPVALLPVFEENFEAIRLMRQFGVDYSKLKFKGATALEFAKQTGNSALLKALEQNTKTL